MLYEWHSVGRVREAKSLLDTLDSLIVDIDPTDTLFNTTVDVVVVVAVVENMNASSTLSGKFNTTTLEQ